MFIVWCALFYHCVCFFVQWRTDDIVPVCCLVSTWCLNKIKMLLHLTVFDSNSNKNCRVTIFFFLYTVGHRIDATLFLWLITLLASNISFFAQCTLRKTAADAGINPTKYQLDSNLNYVKFRVALDLTFSTRPDPDLAWVRNSNPARAEFGWKLILDHRTIRQW